MNVPGQENDNSKEFNLYQELISAIENHNCGQVYDLIHNYGISPNTDIDGKSPVTRTAHLGHVDILDILVEGGCDLTRPERDYDVWHRQPIHIAASKGHVPFVKQLLNLEVDVNSRDNDERTPLHWAAVYGNNEMTEFLISEGAAVNTAQSDGFTPLHAATCLGHNQVCKILLKYGAQIELADRDGWTAFHTSVCYGHAPVVKTMLDAGTPVDKLTSDEENVIHIAASSGHTDIARLLVDKDLDINAVNLNGNTAFYMAIFYNELEMAKYLVKIGANTYKSSPLYLAALRCAIEFITLFILSGHNFSKEAWLIQKDYPVELGNCPEVCDLLHQLATNPTSLKHMCANVVRKNVGYNTDEGFTSKLSQIGLPPILQELVSYKHIDQIKPIHDEYI